MLWLHWEKQIIVEAFESLATCQIFCELQWLGKLELV